MQATENVDMRENNLFFSCIFHLSITPSVGMRTMTPSLATTIFNCLSAHSPERTSATGSRSANHRRLAVPACRKAKFNCPLPGSPSGRPLIEAPNRAVLANSWNGYEGVFDYLIDVAILVILARVFPTGVFLSLHVGVQLTELTVSTFRVVQCSTTAGGYLVVAAETT
jgi:hypothetical protein